jgi:hypothetical protein
MSWTQNDVDALKAAMARAGNVAEFQYSDGSRTRFLTPAQARELLREMEADVRAATSTPVRGVRFATRSGY